MSIEHNNEVEVTNKLIEKKYKRKLSERINLYSNPVKLQKDRQIEAQYYCQKLDVD